MIHGKKILITGGAGFLGSFVTERLAPRNPVTVLDDLSTGSLGNLAGARCCFVRGHVWDARALDMLKRGRFDFVLHLAANAYIPSSVKDPAYDFDNNLVQPFRLLDFVRGLKKKPRLLFFSSAAVHGDTRCFPMRETDRPVPVSPYGAGKMALEHYASVYARCYGIPAQVIRLYPMFGPRQRKQVFYDLMVKIAAPGPRVAVFGTGREVRDFIYVEDAAAGVERILEVAAFTGGCVNLCSGRGRSITEVAEALMAAMNVRKRLAYTRALRPGDVDKMAGSVLRLKEMKALFRTPFTECVRKTVSWFQASQ
ncbi:MAG: NAD-dependent epimerase/dehydratase family protein [Fibrobacterota bacterium]